MSPTRIFRLALVALALLALLPSNPIRAATLEAIGSAPELTITQTISDEPLLGGQVSYSITLRNPAPTPVADRGYNLTITDTLPLGLSFSAADPAPSQVAAQPDGTTLLIWENLADLEAGEALALSVSARLDASLTIGMAFTNTVTARLNSMPDNSGVWINASSTLTAQPQALDLEASVAQSSSGHQVSGAGELVAAPGARAGADWPYRYDLTLRNNQVGATTAVSVTAILPPGVAYLGNPTISPNPTGATVTPMLTLQEDGSLILRWAIGTLTTAQYAAPISISFDAAVPYAYRTGADDAAATGPFAGPMQGAPIPEDTVLALTYEAQGVYGDLANADGTQTTPDDDAPATITADYLTVNKTVAPKTVGIGTKVSFDLSIYIAEYYQATDVLLTDVLPDGMSYVEGSASQAPFAVQPNRPGPGQTTLIWAIDPALTSPGATIVLSFVAEVDPIYEAAPYTGQPVVSADRLTNAVILTGSWIDVSAQTRVGAASPDEARASVATQMPSLDKRVWRADLEAWSSEASGFTGDTLRFRLRYASASNVDARAIIIRDFLPRGMRYVPGSASHTVAGSFSSSPDCASAPTTPTLGTLGGLDYLEWRLCNAARGATWEATIEARLGAMPDLQPGWLVANFGKLTGQGTRTPAYSLRDSTGIAYLAPELLLTKSASPSTGLSGGSEVNYTITVINNGPVSAYNLVVTDQVPADLLVAASGGSASPSSSSYVTTSGNPAAGQGGVLTWATVASLAPGATQTFRYAATVPGGLAAGAQMTNQASVSYNSRADGAGHQWAATASPDDLNTDDETVYLRGVTLSMGVTPNPLRPGDTATWTITGNVPAGVVAYWPSIQANSLPQGFTYLRTTAIQGATLDNEPSRHPQNPLADGQREVRWFLNTIDNTMGSSAAIFTISFETLFNGYKPGSPTTQYYTNNAIRSNGTTSAYVGWYDTAAGYQGTGGGYDGFDTTKTTRRSPRAQATATLVQPALVLSAGTDRTVIGANENVTLRLQVRNQGFSPGYDLSLEQLLPVGLTFVSTQSSVVSLPANWSGATPVITDRNTLGATALSYELDLLPNGATWTTLLVAQADAGIAADLTLTAQANLPTYSSQPGVPGDIDNDTIADERVYRGNVATVMLGTPGSTLGKTVALDDGELTYGGTLVYTLTLPATPLNATLYTAVVTDPVNLGLAITGVSAGTISGTVVRSALGTIPPGEQRTVTINARLPEGSLARDGTAVPNQASYTTANSALRTSNPVASTVRVPALVVSAAADRAEVQADDQLSYLVTVANVGSGRAEALTLAPSLPPSIRFVNGSARLNGAPLADPSGTPLAWSLPDLQGGTVLTLTFDAAIESAEAGVGYPASFQATGRDLRGQAIPADNSARVAADDDDDDRATAAVYGPLVWTTERSIVAFEDLKKFDWSDWDYNDFLVRITIRRGALPSNDLAAVELHYEALARGAGFLNHAFHHQLPLTGGGWYSLRVNNPEGAEVCAEHAGFNRDDPTLVIFANTRVALPQPAPTMEQTNTRIEQQGVVAGHAATLTVVLSDPTANPLDGLRPLPWDPYLHVIETSQEVHLVQPGRLDNTQTVSNRFDRTAPLIGYDLPLARSFPEEWRWPQEFAGIWRGYPSFVPHITSGGTTALDWFSLARADMAWLWPGAIPRPNLAAINAAELEPDSRYFASPVTADLTGDGRPEVIIGNLLANQLEVYDERLRPLTGWPQTLGGGVRAAAAVADLDGDQQLEVLVGAEDGRLYAWHHDGTALAGWPISVGVELDTTYRILATPAVGDLDGDGQPEVVVPLSDGRLYAFNADGSPRPGWPVSIGEIRDAYASQILNSSPRIHDLDGDNSPEIVVGSTNGMVYVFHADGSLSWTFATDDMILATPMVADFNSARPGYEVAIGSGDGYVYLLAADGTRLWRRSTGWTVRSSVVAADVDGDGDRELVVGSDDDKLWIWHHDGSRLAGWPQATGADIFGTPAVGDIDGDGIAEVLVGSDDAHVYAWHRDGQTVAGWPRAMTLAVKGAPALANVDADPALEVVGADMGGVLRLWGGYEALYLPLIRQP
ncbi:FG-GAP-like repeat-containing protein [Candidatus Chloroploca sp. Khr17]|uniref:FG-GAP-like repeat-containing protein n=1 Tax=Candidatus Chloroploca sp. Khr17 TaxID=2496869 RepID=UPI0013E9B1A9|nr:FG-GAP-like repeat-containing protein [Candidatus Chloroploca sp. Khr17]